MFYFYMGIYGIMAYIYILLDISGIIYGIYTDELHHFSEG